MGVITIQEMIIKEERSSLSTVIGYKLYIKNGVERYDFGRDLLMYVFETYLNYFNTIVMMVKPIECHIKDGKYVSNEYDAMELQSEQDVDEVLLKHAPLGKSTLNITNLLYFRYLTCKANILDLEIVLGDITSVSINTRLSSVWGRCSRIRTIPYTYKIEISEKLFLGTNSYEGIDNTIIHELLHTCRGCFNHGTSWKRVAMVICVNLGYDIKRLSSEEEKGFDAVDLIVKGYYACQCESCGNVVTRKTECEFILHPEFYSCGACGGKFIRIS